MRRGSTCGEIRARGIVLQVARGNMAQQSDFPYVAQDNFSDLIGQLAEARR
jgi:hypothetical protein